MVVWLVSAKEVTLCWAQLALGRVTVCKQVNTLVCNQPARVQSDADSTIYPLLDGKMSMSMSFQTK